MSQAIHRHEATSSNSWSTVLLRGMLALFLSLAGAISLASVSSAHIPGDANPVLNSTAGNSTFGWGAVTVIGTPVPYPYAQADLYWSNSSSGPWSYVDSISHECPATTSSCSTPTVLTMCSNGWYKVTATGGSNDGTAVSHSKIAHITGTYGTKAPQRAKPMTCGRPI